MAEELGRIKKPNVDDYKQGRKLYFIPLVFSSRELSQEYNEINDRYWEQVESQLAGLEAKLGKTEHIFHELVPESGEEGLKTLKQLKVDSLKIIESRLAGGSALDPAEDEEILAELMDWSRCLALGLQSPAVYSTIYTSYIEASNKRNESITKKIDQTVKENQSAILIMGEGHKVTFPSDMRVFYISPPALDELKRWLRDNEAKPKEAAPPKEAHPQEEAEPEESEQKDSENSADKPE
ncbi:MAG: hypothetical protein JXA46_16695 [Dehalococcoidales bacterium]|nr:hypothetical protein [Dehalococcoidales bacterium]